MVSKIFPDQRNLSLLIAYVEEEDEDDEDESEPEPEPEPEKEKRPSRSAAAPGAGADTPSGLATPSGYQSQISTVPSGLETPEFIDLRKNTRAGTESTGPRDLYQVVPEKETSVRGFMGSSTGYDLGNISKSGASGPGVLGDDRGHKVSLSPPPISSPETSFFYRL